MYGLKTNVSNLLHLPGKDLDYFFPYQIISLFKKEENEMHCTINKIKTFDGH